MKRMGAIEEFVGLEVTGNRSERTISLSQQKYIKKLLTRFNVSTLTETKLPIPPKTKFRATTDLSEAVNSTICLQRVGSIMFLMLASRSDLAFASGVLARYNRNPNTSHLAAVRRVFECIASTQGFKLVLGGTTDCAGYVDAAWADDGDTGRSTCGYVFTVGRGAVSWSSQLQPSR